MARQIHASIDENGNAKGGSAGDQTGKEVCIRSFDESRDWDYVLIADATTRALMKKKAIKLCKSNLVGYDQNQRNTLHTYMKKYDYNASKYIKSGKKTETDCSAFMTLLAIASGVDELEYKTSGNAPTTSTMVDKFVDTGKFKKKKYSKGMTLKSGYILVQEGHHTAMYLA